MKTRGDSLKIASEQEFDLLVVGGGIVGAGVAQDAASRGLSVLLLEKGDFASGTSSRTTKLIHGGLRYLEQFQFRLTRELCQERGLLEQLAPHLIKDFSFILPVCNDKKLFGLKAGVGLTIYDLLSLNARGVRRHQRLSLAETVSAAPSLDASRLSSGLRFHDCITDDSRVVMAVIKSACSFGAIAINYLEATGFQTADGDSRVEAVNCRDVLSGAEIVIRCRTCVNATGVWSDKLLSQIDPTWRQRVKPAKGTHIMLPSASFETSTALFLPTDDGRYVFVVPWQNALMVGTTDMSYDGPLDNPVATAEEIDYLLAVLNSYRNHIGNDGAVEPLSRSDVVAAWAGLRPLVSDEKAGAEPGQTSNISREHSLFEGPGGIIGLIGGKLTNYRMLASHVVDMALAQLCKREQSYLSLPNCKTNHVMLGGWIDHADFLATAELVAARGQPLALDQLTVEHLVATYGKDALSILDLVEQNHELVEHICPDFPAILAEVHYCLANEMAMTLDDMLSRRIRLGFVNQQQCLQSASKVAGLIGALGYWDGPRSALEVDQFQKGLLAQLSPLTSLESKVA
ncbi:MAG: glycerol-3-phosphate dehydrogenase/oxidase [Candidatus Melainabacteria bacterium]|nr:glycerol-3-phosphate dehydrogenase/oxidase [Candidatus Melainabacteria bacterium]